MCLRESLHEVGWKGTKSLGRQNEDRFMSSDKNCPDEKEMPIAIVAMAATAVSYMFVQCYVQ